MMSLEYIEQLSREAATQAAEEGRVPFIVWPEDLDNIPPFPFPFLGDYCPDNWERVDLDGPGVFYNAYFVDSSGFGGDGTAMDIADFIDLLEPGYGYAITEGGQFQVRVGKYQKIGQWKQHH